MQNDFVFGVSVVIHHDCTVNPHGKFIEEFAFVFVNFCFIEVDKVFWAIFAKHISSVIGITTLWFIKQYFWKNENYVPYFFVRIVIIPNVAHRHFLLYIL